MIRHHVGVDGIEIKTKAAILQDASIGINMMMTNRLGVKTPCAITRVRTSEGDRHQRSITTMTAMTRHRREVEAIETESGMTEATALTTTGESHAMTTIAATKPTDATNVQAVIAIERETGIETGTTTDATNPETNLETETTTDETATKTVGARAGVLLAAAREQEALISTR